VGQAVEAAGGPADDADLDALNLAARLTDGQRLAVPRRGEPSPAGTTPADGSRGAPRGAPPSDAKLNLNTATATQLDALPGIGPSYAGRILEYRERNGPFRSVQQLRDAHLVPAATYERIRDRLTVE
jgi:competence protein ComEA